MFYTPQDILERHFSPDGAKEVNTRNDVSIATAIGSQNHSDATVEFGEALAPGSPLSLFSDDKPDRFFRVIKSWIDQTLGESLALRIGVPSYEVEDEEGRIHLLIHFPIDEEDENRWCLWRPDQAGFDSRFIFQGALVEE